MKSEAEWRSWDLSGLNVTQLLIDFRFHVHMWSLERDLLISFGTPFIFRSPAGEIHDFNPERNEELSPLFSLLHRSVVSFAASSEGECVLKFEDGAALYGKPHEQYEAWESHGTGSLEPASLLCGVGGGSPWR